MRTLPAAALLAALALPACKKTAPPAPAPPGEASGGAPAQAGKSCFEVVAGKESAGTREVFAKRHLQGGGPTWSAVLEVLVRDHATVGGEETAQPPGLPKNAMAMHAEVAGAPTWYAVDDEGDTALFCSGNASLYDAVRADRDRLDAQPGELEKALDRAKEFGLE